MTYQQSAVLRGEVIDAWQPALDHYRQVRRRWRALTTAAVRSLTHEQIAASSRLLGTQLGERLVTNPQWEWPVVLDYAVHVHHGGRNAIQRMLVERPPASLDHEMVLEALTLSTVCILEVDRVDEGVGMWVYETFTDVEHLITCPHLSVRCMEGDRLITRLVELPGITLATDVVLPLSDEGLFAATEALVAADIDPSAACDPDSLDTLTRVLYQVGLEDGV